jgi:HK97 family phage prohead protease
MERRIISLASHPVRLEQRVGTDYPYAVGLASVFYNAADPGTEYTLWDYEDDKAVERILPTAFDAVLRQGVDCAALFNHDPNMLLGRTLAGTLSLEKTDAGLAYAIQMPDCPMAANVLESIKRGDLRGSSFSFRVNREGQRWIAQGKLSIREIHSISELYDVGPVVFPAYPATTAGLRSVVGSDVEARKAFEAWRAEQRKRATLAQAEVRARCVRLGL